MEEEIRSNAEVRHFLDDSIEQRLYMLRENGRPSSKDMTRAMIFGHTGKWRLAFHRRQEQAVKFLIIIMPIRFLLPLVLFCFFYPLLFSSSFSSLSSFSSSPSFFFFISFSSSSSSFSFLLHLHLFLIPLPPLLVCVCVSHAIYF